MCGLFGVKSATTLTRAEKEACRFLNLLSTPRGKDSTGLVGIEHKYNKSEKDEWEYCIEKDTVSPLEFIQAGYWDEYMSGVYGTIAGHNRFATVGEKSDLEGAHPFVIEGPEYKNFLVGMHNGTLSRYLESKDKNPNDSHKLFSAISSKGLKESLNELRENSAYALVWVDHLGDLNFFRNNQRPLWFMEDKFGSTIFWASEERFLKSMSAYCIQLNLKDPYLLKSNAKVNISGKGIKIKFKVSIDYLEKEVLDRHEKKYAAWTHGRSGTVGGANTRDRDLIQRPYVHNPITNKNYSSSINTFSSSLKKIYARGLYAIKNRSIYRTNLSGNLEYDDGLILQYDRVKYERAFEEYRYQECLKSKIPFVTCDERDESMVVYSFNGKKGRIKKNIFDLNNKSYKPLWDIYFEQYSLFEEFIETADASWGDMVDSKLHTLESFNREVRLRNLVIKAEVLKKKQEDKQKKKEEKQNLTFYENCVKKEEEAKTPVKKLYLVSKTTCDSIPREDTQVEDIAKHYHGNRLMSIKEAEKLLSDGCSNCSSQKDLSDEVYWGENNQYICGDCIEVCSQNFNVYSYKRGVLMS